MRALLWPALAVVAACAAINAMPEPPEGRMLFVENCASCHGPAGDGVGATVQGLSPAPPDLTRIAARDGAFDRARILGIIDGYSRGGVDGRVMPEFGALLRGSTVPVDAGDGVLTPTPRPLAALLVYIESIQVAP